MYTRPKLAEVREVMKRVDKEKRAKDPSPLLQEYMRRMLNEEPLEKINNQEILDG